MAKVIKFDGRFTKKIDLKDSDNKFICTIEVAITTDDIGTPIIHITCDNEEIFENKNTYEFSFVDLLDGIAKEYLDGFYSEGSKYPVRSYKHLASILRHFTNLMELKAEENKHYHEQNTLEQK